MQHFLFKTSKKRLADSWQPTQHCAPCGLMPPFARNMMFRSYFSRGLLLAFLFSALPGDSGQVVESDICVYGATSGGVAAAVAAARLGKSVVLLSENYHVGGMSASGLGVTDIGPGNNTAYLGGISREFYRRVGQKYGTTNLVIWFEPHVAESVFREMLEETTVMLYTNQLIASASRDGQRLTEIVMEDGSVYRAKMYIDTSYEGDLMALARVSFTVGREGTNVYGESLAGIRPLGGAYNYDPYVVAGNPASGLLPFVQAPAGGIVGDGDHRLQAYNFRLCLTQNATNKIPIAPPANYSEARYELFRRYINARIAQDGSVSLGNLIHIQTIIPNGKTDINANGELSTDYVGYNYTWATNTHAGRALLRQEHEDYIRGLFHFLATSTNLPASLRSEAQSWGLAKDEFQDTGGWPWQIYVREARRMVSDYVMIQQNADGRRVAADPIALARYNIDSHGVQRLPSGGFSRWEGSIGGTPPYPYGISYRSIIPRVGECENLFVTFALSASHVGFASVRMEPVFMMTSQSAATAAAFALDDRVPVQQVDYAKLSAQLRADGQLLTWDSPSASTNGIILDQGGPGTASAGSWTFGANAGGWNGDYWHDQASSKGAKWVKYTPTLPTNGTYEVSLWWVEASNRATNTPVDVIHAAGTNRFLVNQRLSSGGWHKLLTTNFNAGTNGSVIIRNDNTTGNYVIADGVRFQPVGDIALPPPPPVIEVVASDAVAGEFGPNPARFAFVRSGDLNPAVPISYVLAGSASNGVDYTLSAGSVVLAAGALATNLVITPLPDSLAEGDETLTLHLLPSTHYGQSRLTNATIILRDQPLDDWRKANFTEEELGQADLSGDTADPDKDRLANLMEYALGLPPKHPDAADRPWPRIEAGNFLLTYTRAKAASDVALSLDYSPDLRDWQDATSFLEPVACLDEGTRERITVRLLAPVASQAAAWLRLRATRLASAP